MPGNAPVDAVGGPQEEGPWPEEVEEILEGDSYQRPVRLADGSLQEVQVTVTTITELPNPDGDLTTGHAVAYQYDDPTDDGGQA